ncbi:MAG: TIGR01777 family oxidoreductase, partial [Bacteroidales bacterium]|nr:TIGR01777 family oxidoreductase [Bacteroidales bacterium]
DYINRQDVVINLAGAPLSGRWSEPYKKELIDSRVETTRKITRAILQADHPPACLINASAVAIYDDRKKHTEESQGFAENFLATLCRQWETEAMKAAPACRVVVLRMGVVLSKNEGVLEKMTPFFKKGIGSRIGNGNQGVSWIHIDDLVEVFLFLITNPGIEGIVNAVGEYPTDNFHFSESLGKMFGQPVYFSIPKLVVKLIFGEGAIVLTEGQKVIPAKLLRNGFKFEYISMDKALVGIYRE